MTNVHHRVQQTSPRNCVLALRILELMNASLSLSPRPSSLYGADVYPVDRSRATALVFDAMSQGETVESNGAKEETAMKRAE